jgi:hypothetical protein
LALRAKYGSSLTGSKLIGSNSKLTVFLLIVSSRAGFREPLFR